MKNYTFNDDTWYFIGSSFTEVPSDLPEYTRLYTLSLRLPYQARDISTNSVINDFVINLPATTDNILLTINDEIIVSQEVNNPDFPCKSRFISCPVTPDNLELKINVYLNCHILAVNVPLINPVENKEFIIGTPSAIYTTKSKMIIMDILFTSIFVMSTLFHLCVYYFRKNSANLHISLFCFSFMLLMIVSNQHLLTYLVNGITPNIVTHLYILACILRVIAISLFIQNNNISRNHKQQTAILESSIIILGILAFFIPTHFISLLILMINLLSIYLLVSLIIILIDNYRKNTSNSTIYIIIGTFILLSGSIAEILFNTGIAGNLCNMFMYVSYILFILVQSAHISYSNALAITHIKRLTTQLKDSVLELQQNTSTFISTHIKPTYLYETLDSIISHIDDDQEKVDKLIQSLSKYLRQTLDVSEEGNLHKLSAELEFCNAYLYLIKEQNPSIKIIYDIPEKYPDVEVPKYSLQALIENSVLHAFRGILHPQITIKIDFNFDEVEISVTDNGIGMTQEDIVYAKTSPVSNVNIGIYHINKILEDTISSSLNISSEINKYTTAGFTIHYDNTLAKEDKDIE